jgi:hypothetical protein
VVVHGVMLDRAVIPQDQVAGEPAMSVTNIEGMAALVKILEKRLALVDLHVLEGDREARAYVEGLAASFWMGSDDGMELAVFSPVAALAHGGA